MSTTLTVLHVLMSADHDKMDNTDGLLALQSTSAKSSIVSLDPVLEDFWSDFPCPPPWNEGLLFSVNWSSCVSQSVGERIKWHLADRCNILIPGLGGHGQGPGDGGGGGEGDYDSPEEMTVACDVPCKVLVSLFCCLFLIVGFVLGAIFFFRRRQSRRKDVRGGQQSTAGSGTDRSRNLYAGIHYASAPVVGPGSERPLPPRPDGDDSDLPQQLHSYVYNPHHDDDDDHNPEASDSHHHRFPSHHHHHGFHLHLCPMNRRAAYSAMEQSPVSEGGDDFPHHYEYISDEDDSERYLRVGGGGGGGGAAGRGTAAAAAAAEGIEGGREYGRAYCSCEDKEAITCMLPEHSHHPGHYNYPSPGLWEGYPTDRMDQARQHEISKPYPRYPEEGAAVRVRRSTGGALDSRNPDTLLGFPNVPVSVIDARDGARYLPAVRTRPSDLSGGNRSIRGLRGQDNKAYPGVVTPEDSTPPHIISPNSGILADEYPNSFGRVGDRLSTSDFATGGYHSHLQSSTFHHSGHTPLEPSPSSYRDNRWRPDDAPYRSILPSAGFPVMPNVYEAYPQGGRRAADERFGPKRDRAVGIHPQFYMDLLEGGTSSV